MILIIYYLWFLWTIPSVARINPYRPDYNILDSYASEGQTRFSFTAAQMFLTSTQKALNQPVNHSNFYIISK